MRIVNQIISRPSSGVVIEIACHRGLAAFASGSLLVVDQNLNDRRSGDDSD
jgi:hypothetical protein